MTTDEEVHQHLLLLCDEDTTEEERAMFEFAIRLGDGLTEARRMAEDLCKHLRQLHHCAWNTPSEAALLGLYSDARYLRDNIFGWDDYSKEAGEP